MSTEMRGQLMAVIALALLAAAVLASAARVASVAALSRAGWWFASPRQGPSDLIKKRATFGPRAHDNVARFCPNLSQVLKTTLFFTGCDLASA